MGQHTVGDLSMFVDKPPRHLPGAITSNTGAITLRVNDQHQCEVLKEGIAYLPIEPRKSASKEGPLPRLIPRNERGMKSLIPIIRNANENHSLFYKSAPRCPVAP